MDEAKEVKIPAALLGLAFVSTAVHAFLMTTHAASSLTDFALQVIIGVPVALIACMLTSGLIGKSFGRLGPACVKLGAIYMFPYALTVWIPVGGWVVSLLLYFGLVAWLFELEGYEPIVFTVVLLLVSFVVGAIVTFASA